MKPVDPNIQKIVSGAQKHVTDAEVKPVHPDIARMRASRREHEEWAAKNKAEGPGPKGPIL